MTNEDEQNRVITLDNYRAFEKPGAVIYEGVRHEVVVCESLYVATGVDPSSPVRRAFEVRCDGGTRFRLELTEGVGWQIDTIPGPTIVR